MSTDTRPDHLKNPDGQRLAERLADAQNQRLIPVWANTKNLNGARFTRHYFTCTPQMKPEPYRVYLYLGENEEAERFYAHCTCPAGEHGIACKHLASVLDTMWDVTRLEHLRVLTTSEHDELVDTGKEPQDQ